MRERAARERLPRSVRQAAELERLGMRMEGGTLSRDQAVGELRRMEGSLAEERRQALAEARGADGGSRGAPARGGDALDKALRSHRAGSDEALRQILENLARTERARKEDQELGRAREQVLRSRENLGDAAAARQRAPFAGIEWDDEEGDGRDARSAESKRADGQREGESGRADSRSASRGEGDATERAQSPYREEPAPRGPVLQPKGDMREGESHSSHARLPARAGRPGVENVQMAREFAPQVEEVLSREHYPAHYKEFIRRYFLSLSRGARGAPDEPVTEKGAQ
jgi:hypothetical protein